MDTTSAAAVYITCSHPPLPPPQTLICGENTMFVANNGVLFTKPTHSTGMSVRVRVLACNSKHYSSIDPAFFLKIVLECRVIKQAKDRSGEGSLWQGRSSNVKKRHTTSSTVQLQHAGMCCMCVCVCLFVCCVQWYQINRHSIRAATDWECMEYVYSA